jgi:hypothetical protein
MAAALAESGWTQRMLAEAVGVSPALIRGFLTPVMEPPSSMMRTPNPVMARRIAQALQLDGETHERLFYHLQSVWSMTETLALEPEHLPGGDVENILQTLNQLHSIAMYGSDPVLSRAAYIDMIGIAGHSVTRIDPVQNSLDRAQVLMYLHDAECVLGCANVALAHAREAVLILSEVHPSNSEREHHGRLRVNASQAVTVALHNLGLPTQALENSHRTQALPEFAIAGSLWLPFVLVDRLNVLKRIRRFTISEAEELHIQARELVPDVVWSALADLRLAEALLSYGTPRSLRKALPYVSSGVRLAENEPALGPLHRVLLFRAAADYAHQVGDRSAWEKHLRQCLRINSAAGLIHQQAQLNRTYGDSQHYQRLVNEEAVVDGHSSSA